jgi:hypothetical protein
MVAPPGLKGPITYSSNYYANETILDPFFRQALRGITYWKYNVFYAASRQSGAGLGAAEFIILRIFRGLSF